ncbi:HPF/RaiA family ribosome-associated protein [Pseudomonas benzenivorans]|uniref:HPF/RaiA family ribosome-associated protein n=1 Tax=Pseudomonas benzenivorans TaxID=556533 RepID=A0ABZ0PY48_9PSED|nr:HPF/RaiA family ribosome-associated protein [Pseudomonas benzenivorans]WPC05450.1 HPF/RaiA family ribosome-associated protein [Pseudomonas benzenivorans]
MHVQVNIHQIEGNARLQNWVSATLTERLQRYADLLTRIEVHISDENAHKSGPDDKRCQIEARPKGQQAISVTHKAQDLELAVDGATEKMRHALEHLMGKLEAKATANGRLQSPRETSSDALLQEEFLAKQEELERA